MNRIDLDQLARDIDVEEAEAFPIAQLGPVAYAQPGRRQMPLPSYVTHAEGITGLGVISAEATVHQWENAAKIIEAMGAELRKVVERCEVIAKSAQQAIDFTEQTAAAYRDEGAKIFKEIESHALLVEEVRKSCEGFRAKIAEQISSA